MKKDRQFWGDLAFFGVILFVLAATAGGHIVQGDEETMFRVTQNLAHGRGLAVGREEITLPAQPAPFLPRHDETFWTTSAVPGRDGLLYSWYGIGQSVVVIPLYAAGMIFEKWVSAVNPVIVDGYLPRLFVSFLNPIVIGGCSYLLVLVCRLLGYRNQTGYMIGAVYAFASMAWPYVKTFYPQPSVAFLILFIFYSGLQWKQTGKKYWIHLLSAAGCMIVLFRPSGIIFFPAIALYLWLSSPKTAWINWLPPFALWVGSGILATLFYNWLRFGSILSTGYNDVISWSTPFLLGLYGLLFSPGKGVFLYTPILILCVAASIPFAKKYRNETILIGFLWISILGFYSGYNFWTGGFNWGPRFLLPLIPISLVPLGVLWDDTHSSMGKFVVIGFFCLGFMIQFPAVIVDQSRYLTSQLAVDDKSAAYNQTLYDFAYSPIPRQYQYALDLLAEYREPGTRLQAANAIRDLNKTCSASRNCSALIVSEFLRRNTIDFWWLHVGLISSE